MAACPLGQAGWRYPGDWAGPVPGTGRAVYSAWCGNSTGDEPRTGADEDGRALLNHGGSQRRSGGRIQCTAGRGDFCSGRTSSQFFQCRAGSGYGSSSGCNHGQPRSIWPGPDFSFWHAATVSVTLHVAGCCIGNHYWCSGNYF